MIMIEFYQSVTSLESQCYNFNDTNRADKSISGNDYNLYFHLFIYF